MVPSDKLEITQQVCGYSPFQNGINQNSERANAKKGRMHTSPSLSPFTKNISGSNGRPDMAIQDPPLWTK